jgi:hypothetical protein
MNKLAFHLATLLVAGAAIGCTATASLTLGADSCATDSTVDCSASGTTGYQCSGIALPSDTDSTLVCSSGTDDPNGNTDYCCASGVISGFGCSTDSSLGCVSGSTGMTCQGGAAPDSSNSSCSVGQTNSDGTVSYCCIPFVATGGTCQPDESVGASCVYPSFGYSCATGDNPATTDATLNCSDPVTVGGLDTFCCTYGTVGTGGTGGTTTGGTTDSCVADSTLDCSADPTSTGYSCTGVAFPTDVDPTLICSTGSDQGGGVLGYCCAATSATFGCMADATLDCSADPSSTGMSCVGGATPDTTTQICSYPSDQGGGVDGYCCVAITPTSGTTCAPDDTVTGCQYPSIGFSCLTGDDPTSLDASLNCSVPTTVGSEDLFCCK